MRVRSYVGMVAALPLLAGACSSGVGGTSDETSRSCVARLVVDGREYTGTGGLVREPDVTGEEVEATLPGCNDTGGEDAPDEAVIAFALDGIDPQTALLFGSDVYISEGSPQDEHLSELLRHWRSVPACETAGPFTLSGDWLGVRGPHEPDVDGDIRAPYRLTMHVDDGPEQYVRTQVVVRVTASTTPALDQDDVETSLWAGGTVTAEVECDGRRFVAVSVSSSPP